MNRIPIKDAIIELGYKDRRSFKRWCANNGVKILSDLGSRKFYIIKEEFEEAKSRRAVEYLNQKGIQFQNRSKYRPQGEHERKYFSILTGIISE